jgi:hypothetical protein
VSFFIFTPKHRITIVGGKQSFQDVRNLNFTKESEVLMVTNGRKLQLFEEALGIEFIALRAKFIGSGILQPVEDCDAKTQWFNQLLGYFHPEFRSSEWISPVINGLLRKTATVQKVSDRWYAEIYDAVQHQHVAFNLILSDVSRFNLRLGDEVIILFHPQDQFCRIERV